jgi:hypothetical protein
MTSPLLVNAPALGVASAVETAGTTTMAGTGAGAAGPVTAIMGPGAEDASAAAQAAFTARGVETMGMLGQLVMVRGLFAGTIASSGAAYAATDAINQAVLTI